MDRKVTAPRIRAMKGGEAKIVCVTAYDYASARIADEAGADLILVGDSLANVVLGLPTTLHVSLEDLRRHTAAASRGVKRGLLVADLPFGSYNSSPAQAMDSAVALVQAGAESVKLEGLYLDEIERITRSGVPVMGHIGMTPQSVHRFGGFRVQGKGEAGEEVLQAARELADAGVYAIVLELIPAALAARVTAEVGVPTIGIGAGPECDGQIQVFHDLLGLGDEVFKHAKQYLNGREAMTNALRQYADEVRKGVFPASENSF